MSRFFTFFLISTFTLGFNAGVHAFFEPEEFRRMQRAHVHEELARSDELFNNSAIVAENCPNCCSIVALPHQCPSIPPGSYDEFLVHGTPPRPNTVLDEALKRVIDMQIKRCMEEDSFLSRLLDYRERLQRRPGRSPRNTQMFREDG